MAKARLPIGALVSGLIAAGAVTGPTQAADTVTLNLIQPTQKSMSFYPHIAAEALGYFEEEGLEVNLLPSATTVPFVAFLQNGDADIAILDAPQTFQAINAGVPLSIVYEVHQLAPEGVVVPDGSPIRSVKELHGKTVGLVSDRDLATLQLTMVTVGEDMDDIETVVLGEGGPILANAFRKSTVAAIAGSRPDWLALEANGIKLTHITPPKMREQPGNSFAVVSSRLPEIEEALAGFLRAWAKGAYVAEVDKEALAMMSRELVPVEWVNQEYGRKYLEGAIVQNLPLTDRFGELRPNVWRDVQGRMVKIGEIKQTYDPEKFLDPSLLKAANDWDKEEVAKEVAAWKEEHS